MMENQNISYPLPYGEFRKKTKIGIGIGFFLKYLGGIIYISTNGFAETINNLTGAIFGSLIGLIGFFIFINGCASYIKLKGYRRGWGALLGLMDLLGLIILFLLPEKPNKYEVFAKDFKEEEHKKNWQTIFILLETRHKNNYPIMVERIVRGFSGEKNKPMLILEVIANALDKARMNPTKENWEELKKVLLENPPEEKRKINL